MTSYMILFQLLTGLLTKGVFLFVFIHNYWINSDFSIKNRNAIEKWLDDGNEKSPMTNLILEYKILVPNIPLKQLIQSFLSSLTPQKSIVNALENEDVKCLASSRITESYLQEENGSNLWKAASSNNLKIESIKWLLDVGYQPSKLQLFDLLSDACNQGSLSIVKFIIEELKFDIHYVRDNYPPVLHEAVFADHIDIVRYLLDRKAKVNEIDMNGVNSIAYPISVKVANLLLESKAMVDLNAVLYAATHTNLTTLSLLIDKLSPQNKTSLPSCLLSNALNRQQSDMKVIDLCKKLGCQLTQKDLKVVRDFITDQPTDRMSRFEQIFFDLRIVFGVKKILDVINENHSEILFCQDPDFITVCVRLGMVFFKCFSIFNDLI